ncbi:MAG: type I restriction enzyme endonuclease domain-containing protein [Methylococcales bacterium]
MIQDYTNGKGRELAVVLTQRVRENASIDWPIKENVRAKLKVIIRRTLRQYGYPPDMQLLATETVMRQAEMILRHKPYATNVWHSLIDDIQYD